MIAGRGFCTIEVKKQYTGKLDLFPLWSWEIITVKGEERLRILPPVPLHLAYSRLTLVRASAKLRRLESAGLIVQGGGDDGQFPR